MEINRETVLFCFCGPAASGKTTICRELAKHDTGLKLSISTTTRSPRKGEVNGKDYNFVDEAEFQLRLSSGLFIEHATFSSSLYGTEKSNIKLAENSGLDLLLDIDVQGTKNLKKMFPNRLVTIFVFPPSFEILEKRLRERGSENEEKIQSRLLIARQELAQLAEPGFSDYLIINDEVEKALFQARAIVEAERTRYLRFQVGFRKSLLGQISNENS